MKDKTKGAYAIMHIGKEGDPHWKIPTKFSSPGEPDRHNPVVVCTTLPNREFIYDYADLEKWIEENLTLKDTHFWVVKIQKEMRIKLEESND